MQDCVRSPRRSAGAAAAADDEAGDEGGRKKGRSVRRKVEETLTRRPAGTGRYGKSVISKFRGQDAGRGGDNCWTPKKKRAKRMVTEVTTSRGGKRVVL